MTQHSALSTQHSDDERQRRWRLLLGGAAEEALGGGLRGADLAMDRALGALYDGDSGGGSDQSGGGRRGGLGSSAPNVARWLGDIRTYFPC